MYEGQFFKNFSILQDKREQGKVHHKLIDIIFIVVSPVKEDIVSIDGKTMRGSIHEDNKGASS